MVTIDTRDELEALDSCAFEGFEADYVPVGKPAALLGLPKRSRVFRDDDLPEPLPLSFHRGLQWFGVALLGALLTLSALFHRGSLSWAEFVKHAGGAS